MFLEDILKPDEKKWAEKTMCVEVEIIFTLNRHVPCYQVMRYALPEHKTAHFVKDRIRDELEKMGYQVLNVCETTWNTYEFLESAFEVCHNKDYIKQLVNYLMKGIENE